jgi:Ankyrin repeats (3 copies)
MSGADSDDDRADELTERYRAARAGDPTRPSDSVRLSIISHARTVAAAAATRAAARGGARRPAARDSRWHLAAAASVIVAGFATLLAWHLRVPTPPSAQEPNPPLPPASALRQESAAGSTAGGQATEPLTVDRSATAALAPNAVTTRSRQRAVSPTEAPSLPRKAAAELEIQGSSVPSARQATARAADSTAAENTTAQLTRSAAAPAPNAEARRSPALNAAAPSPASAPAPKSLLITAAEAGDLERVDQLLRDGISTEQADARGRTALLIATLRGDIPMVQRLLAAGARADAVDEDGDTPLAAARRQGPPELARLLERATQP